MKKKEVTIIDIERKTTIPMDEIIRVAKIAYGIIDKPINHHKTKRGNKVKVAKASIVYA